MKNVKFVAFGAVALLFQIIQAQTNLNNILITPENKNEASITTTETSKSNENECAYLVVRYYYYPNLSAYYDVKCSKFIFQRNGEWIKEDRIPQNYRGYSLFNNYKVEITDYSGDKPYEYLAVHRKMYPADYKGRLQKMAALANTEKSKAVSMK